MLVVVRLAAYDGAETDDGVVVAGLRQLLRGERYLERAGDARHGDVVVRHAVAFQGRACAVQQLGGNEVVEASDHDCDAESLAAQAALQLAAHSWSPAATPDPSMSSKWPSLACLVAR